MTFKTFKDRERLVERLIRSHDKSPIQWFIRPKMNLPNAEGQGFTGSTRRLLSQSKQSELIETRMIHAWDRRPDESAKQYAAFCHYRDEGADRSLKGTCEFIGAATSQIQLYKRRFEWLARVRAYDEWEEKRLRKVAERAKKEMVERQARLGQTMTGVAQDALESGIIRPETVADVVRLADSGTRIERLARGESTENVATGMRLILAHPLPPWAPEAAKALVDESVYDSLEDDNNKIIDGNVEVPDGSDRLGSEIKA